MGMTDKASDDIQWHVVYSKVNDNFQFFDSVVAVLASTVIQIKMKILVFVCIVLSIFTTYFLCWIHVLNYAVKYWVCHSGTLPLHRGVCSSCITWWSGSGRIEA